MSREPLEDTQLAFYAALVGATSRLPVQRAATSRSTRPAASRCAQHTDVADDAPTRCVDGIADDLRRLRDGAGLPPLGEGSACEYCEARGLCRRDHWASRP